MFNITYDKKKYAMKKVEDKIKDLVIIYSVAQNPVSKKILNNEQEEL